MKALRIITFILSLSILPMSWVLYTFVSGPGLFGVPSEYRDVAFLYLIPMIIPISAFYLFVRGTVQKKSTKGEKVYLVIFLLTSIFATIILLTGGMSYINPF